jgi:hypothetical protein
MSGRLLEAVRIVPPVLWQHLDEQLGVAAPHPASLARGHVVYSSSMQIGFPNVG